MSSNVAVLCWGFLCPVMLLCVTGFLCPVMLLCVTGFLCPVHTPDGTPCGLLNHMSASCQVRRGVLPSLLLSQCLYLFYIYVAQTFYPHFSSSSGNNCHFMIGMNVWVIVRVTMIDMNVCGECTSP